MGYPGGLCRIEGQCSYLDSHSKVIPILYPRYL